MRSVISRCPNYSGCLLGYRGEDIEVADGVDPICPECGAPLTLKAKPRTSLIPSLVNWITIVVLAIAVWFAWPHVKQVWQKITTPPDSGAPPSPTIPPAQPTQPAR
jgi:hypothetical protein